MGEISFSQLWDIAWMHGGALFWAALWGLLIWGAVSLAAGVGVYFGVTRLGWLDLRGQRKTGARVIFGLVLFLISVPAATTAGVVTRVRDATVKVARIELTRAGASEKIGALLVAPAVVAHQVAEQKLRPDHLTAMQWRRIRSQDATFLLTRGPRERAFEKLTGKLVTRALDEVPGQARAKENRVTAWLLQHAKRRAARSADKRMRIYTDLFTDLKPDARGRLSYRSASRQVGAAFLTRGLKPLIHEPFDQARLYLLLIALGALLLTIGLIQLIGRAVVKPAPAAPKGNAPTPG